MVVWYVILYGIVGVLARFGVNNLIAGWVGKQFPWSTLFINLVGSFLIGVVYAAALEKAWISNDTRVALSAGLLGGFTTFSAFSLENLQMIQQSQYLAVACYSITSVLGGVIAAAVGLALVRGL